jgi:aspartate 4-decarboxylase
MTGLDRRLERLDPFELKDQLIALARARARRRGAGGILNAGRGNPDWLALEPREAFFELGRFAMAEARREARAEGLGGAPKKAGIARRLRAYLACQPPTAGTRFLARALRFATGRLGCEADALAHEWVDGACGDHYPEPVRMLPHAERLMRRFLEQEVFAGRRGGALELFAVEGASAGVCYLFDALVANGLLRRGDRIAVAVPIFSPYLEIPQLDRYDFEVVRIDASERAENAAHSWQYPDAEIDKVADPKVKALVLVNPSNPPSVAMRASTLRRLEGIVRTRRRDLIVVTDDVYATFVEDFRSVLAALPRNTIGVYSFSKHFGCTGWRLGVLALHEDNVIDAALQRRSSGQRYASLLLEPRKLKFIDRMVADSRAIAFNHTAGLSTPQQVQMTLLALYGLMDEGRRYKQIARRTLKARLRALYEGLGEPLPADPLRAGYYAELDLAVWGERAHGAAFVRFLRRRHHPIDLLVALARRASIVLMPGASFGGPDWSFRVSLANLPAASYRRIGQAVAAAARGYAREWRREGRARKGRRPR